MRWFTVGILLGALLTPAHAADVTLSDDLPPAQSVLPADVFATYSFHAPEGAGRCEVIQPEAEDAARVVHVEALREVDDHWEIGLTWDTAADVAADDVLLLRFQARAMAAADEPRGSVHIAFRRVKKPYHHAIGDEVQIRGGWRDYRIPFSPSVDMPAGEATLRLNFGTQVQTLELRNLELLNVGGEFSILTVCRLLDIDPGAAGRRAVGEPLRPALLWQMGAWDGRLQAERDFDPAGAWTHLYRIWGCHGYLVRGNKDVGYLRLRRTPGQAPTLAVEQRIANYHGVVYASDATITCAANAIASPLRWRLASTFVGPAGEPLDDLALHETARVEGARIEVREGERTFTRPGSERLAADWCLFDAVQRLPFDPSVDERFDLLEGLSALKRGHRLHYRGAEEIRMGTRSMTLHRFEQIGHGTLPYTYWLADDHRLVIAITHSRAYVLDPDASAVYEDVVRSDRNRWERDRQRHEEGAQ